MSRSTDPTPRAAPRARRRSGGSPSSRPGVPMVPVSSFDFLEGRFRAASKARLFNVVTAAVLAVLLVLVGARSVESQFAATAAVRDQQAVTTQLEVVIDDISSFSAPGRATEGEVQVHVNKRAASAATAAQMQEPYAAYFQAVFSLPNAAVSSMTISVNKQKETVVTIKGSAPTPQSAAAATALLSGDPAYAFLTSTTQPLVSCTGTDTADACAWEWSGKFNTEAPTPRSQQLQERFGVSPQAKPAGPPALSAGEEK